MLESYRTHIGRIRFVTCALLALLCSASWVLAEESAQEQEYSRVIAARSRAIVQPLGISDSESALRIEQAVAGQYRALRDIHDSRDAELKALEASSREASEEKGSLKLEQQIERVRQEAMIKQFQLHRNFIARLSAELTPEQVTGVKDGMTYGVVPKTYARYLEVNPNLTKTEQQTVMALLIEAREYAMDAGSSEAKHGWFRKYKGKINNFLSAAGYKL